MYYLLCACRYFGNWHGFCPLAKLPPVLDGQGLITVHQDLLHLGVMLTRVRGCRATTAVHNHRILLRSADCVAAAHIDRLQMHRPVFLLVEVGVKVPAGLHWAPCYA